MNEVIQEAKFPLYYHPEKKLAISNVQKRVSYAAFYRLNRKFENKFNLKHFDVDFNKVESSVSNVKGAWFSTPKASNIRSQAQYGDQIHNDDDYKKLKQCGDTTALIVVFPYGKTSIKLLVSKDMSVYFFRKKEVPLSDYFDYIERIRNCAKGAALELADVAPAVGIPLLTSTNDSSS